MSGRGPKIETFSCPFCGDDDFDPVGLKHHLEHGHCEAYEKTKTFADVLRRPKR